MTTSIVFDSSMTCLDISHNSSSIINYTDDGEWLSDPTAPRDALQNLRYLKIRETGNTIVTPVIEGRETGNNIDFTEYSYDELKMRRKATILQYVKSDSQSKNKKLFYSHLAKTSKSKYRSISNSHIKQLLKNQNCLGKTIVKKPSTNAGIRAGNTLLFLNKTVPYYSNI